MKLVRLLLLACICMMACRQQPQSNEVTNYDLPQMKDSGELVVLTLNSSTSYFNYRGEPMGFQYELAEQFARSLGVKLRMETAKNTHDLVHKLLTGEGDLIAYNLPITKEFKDSVEFCGEDIITHQVLVQRNSNKVPPLQNVTELIGKEVYVKPGKYLDRLINLDKELGGGILIHKVENDSVTTEDLIMQVSNGTIDYAVCDNDLAKLNKTYYPNLNISMPISFDQRASWAVRKTSPLLAAAATQWHRVNMTSPSYRASSKRYFEISKRIPHGSILVNIRIADDRLHISADFLVLPEKGRVAMLRQVADLNINRLMLARFRKEGDKLMMEYACPLSQSHPHKLYFILRNICHVGDRYDDEFCTKFGAQRSYEPQVTPYPEEEVTRIYEAVRQTCRETLDAVKEYETERKYGYSWNVIDIALYKIAYFAHPQGQLLNDLDKAVDDMDKELPVAELVAKGKAFLERLLAMPREEMARDLYLVDTLVSTKRRSSLNNVQENFKEVYQEATEAIESENFERSTVRILYKFYEMYYYNDVQDDLNAVVAGALGKSAGKTMEEASEILYEALEKIMEDDLSADDGDFDAGELGIAGAAAAEQVQQMAAAMQGHVAQMQAAMQEALAKGDMAEYMRLAQEFQQKMMEQALGQQK